MQLSKRKKNLLRSIKNSRYDFTTFFLVKLFRSFELYSTAVIRRVAQIDLMTEGLLSCRLVESWINLWKSDGKRTLRRIIDLYHIDDRKCNIPSVNNGISFV